MTGIELLKKLQEISPEVLERANVYFNAPDSHDKYYDVGSLVSVDDIGDVILCPYDEMSFDNIFEKVKKIINDVRSLDCEIEIGSDLVLDLGCDSIDMVDIAYRCEYEFEISLKDELEDNSFLEGYTTVEDLVYLIDKKMKKK